MTKLLHFIWEFPPNFNRFFYPFRTKTATIVQIIQLQRHYSTKYKRDLLIEGENTTSIGVSRDICKPHKCQGDAKMALKKTARQHLIGLFLQRILTILTNSKIFMNPRGSFTRLKFA
jgi:hypothetical protein